MFKLIPWPVRSCGLQPGHLDDGTPRGGQLRGRNDRSNPTHPVAERTNAACTKFRDKVALIRGGSTSVVGKMPVPANNGAGCVI